MKYEGDAQLCPSCHGLSDKDSAACQHEGCRALFPEPDAMEAIEWLQVLLPSHTPVSVHLSAVDIAALWKPLPEVW